LHSTALDHLNHLGLNSNEAREIIEKKTMSAELRRQKMSKLMTLIGTSNTEDENNYI